MSLYDRYAHARAARQEAAKGPLDIVMGRLGFAETTVVVRNQAKQRVRRFLPTFTRSSHPPLLLN